MFKRIAEGDIYCAGKGALLAVDSRSVVLPDGDLLVCLWYDEGEKKGIRYVKLAMEA